MTLIRLLPILLVIGLSFLTSCQKEALPPADNERTLFMYLPWSTNLTSYFYQNIADMEEAIARRGLDRERVLVFLSTSATEAELFEITVNNGTCTRRTVKEYTRPAFTTEAGLTDILNDMKWAAPAKSYSLIVGCHGMGWLPVEPQQARASTKFSYHWEYTHTPLTRFFGGLTAEYQTEITTLSRSLAQCGLQMEYILFDDCYMSSLEVAYELRHVTRHLIACPTEIMAYGMPYARIGEYLLAENPDYGAICQAFHRFYSSYTYPYGTIAVTDCSRLDDLVLLMKDLHSRHSLDSSQTASLQRMDGYSPVIFYDFGDYVRALCGNDAAQLAQVEALLEQVVPYKAHTEKFFTASLGPLSITHYSGITTSAPSLSSKARTYPQTSWYRATH